MRAPLRTPSFKPLDHHGRMRGWAPLSFDPTFMKDAQCAEMNEKQFLDIYFSNYRKNLKFDFSFDSADSGSFM